VRERSKATTRGSEERGAKRRGEKLKTLEIGKRKKDEEKSEAKRLGEEQSEAPHRFSQ